MACRVEDTGIGIANEDQDQLFKIFGKLQNLSEVSTSGIGLGLHICKELCDSLGGTIQLVHSQKGQGSTFIFHIPTQGPSVEGEDNIDERRKRRLVISHELFKEEADEEFKAAPVPQFIVQPNIHPG